MLFLLERFNRFDIFLFLLAIDLELLDSLMNSNDNQKLQYFLHLNDSSFNLYDVVIINSPTPVNSPTTRGGVYFSEKFAYKMKGTIQDLSIIPLLSQTMLGPNTQFSEIKITTEIIKNNKKIILSIFTNLTNSIQSPSNVELHMILIRLESV